MPIIEGSLDLFLVSKGYRAEVLTHVQVDHMYGGPTPHDWLLVKPTVVKHCVRPLILVKIVRFCVNKSGSKTQVERLNLGYWRVWGGPGG